MLLTVCAPRLWSAVRAEFISSDPDRWIEPSLISRTAPDYPARSAIHSRQSECNGFYDLISTDFAGSYWITPTSPAGAIVFVMPNVDPLEIFDFHIRIGNCVRGELDFENRLVTATFRLFKDGVLIDEQHIDTRNCILSPDAPDYPSPYQQRLVSSPSVTDAGGMIEIEILLTGADGHPAAGVDVYSRVVDPPDPAPYRSDQRKGDNRDTTPPWVTGAPGYEVQIPGTNDTVLRTDSAGRIYARLHGSTREAGDHYRLRVSLFRSIPDTQECSANMMAAPCFESEVFTVWKRVAVENDRMIQAGTFLQQTISVELR